MEQTLSSQNFPFLLIKQEQTEIVIGSASVHQFWVFYRELLVEGSKQSYYF